MEGVCFVEAMDHGKMDLEPDPLTSHEPQLQAKKCFGQNFLIQQSAIDGICREALMPSSRSILEIGPGGGVLTERLLKDGRPLWAMDLDPEAIDHLTMRFGQLPHFHLLHGDAVKASLPQEGPWSVVGNLPYNAATPILTRFLLEEIPWEKLTFMFQLEVGQKIMGKPGEKAYGPLSVLAQLCCRVTRLMKLGPGAFRPSPKVDSVVLLFEPKLDAPSHATRHRLLKLLHGSFAHRRKTLSNNWASWMNSRQAQALFDQAGVSPSIRAEALSPEIWLMWANSIENGPSLEEISNGSL